MTRIAIVDDDDGMRRALVALLGVGSCQISAYATGEAFLDAVPEKAFDLAVLDLRLPGLTGLKILERLKPFAFPVVMISANGDIRTAVDAIKLGAVDFIEKPFVPEELEGLIERVLRERGRNTEPACPDVEPEQTHFSVLTPREKEVAFALHEGLTNKEVARRLGCSPRTIEVHRARVFSKLGVSNIAGLVRMVSGFSH
ncbi:response regulator [Parvularcula sp. ZS-1/3]|uniref:Response regulator n=1 Tax=Parvularcula mediterranea TaxID=2732508 RepID=A0A7Y3W6N7_9PROT|nr:response regulator [Parvularcula mediterranea]NNU17557.1 response regulator [Parvularcula mediterranea]